MHSVATVGTWPYAQRDSEASNPSAAIFSQTTYETNSWKLNPESPHASHWSP